MTLGLRSAVLAASALILLFSAACGSDDDGDEQAAAPAAAVTVAAATAPSTSGQAAAQAATQAATRTATATASAPAGPQAVALKAGEWFFEPSAITVRPGTVAITMTNDGPARPHTLVIRQPNGGAEIIRTQGNVEVGQSVTLEVNVTAPGAYEMLCMLPGHADRGQKGTFTVAS